MSISSTAEGGDHGVSEVSRGRSGVEFVSLTGQLCVKNQNLSA